MNTTRENLAVLGATGSIGDSTLELARLHRDRYRVYALSGFSQIDKLLALCQELQPEFVCVAAEYVDEFHQKLNQYDLTTTVLSGDEGLIRIASEEAVDTVVAAIVGAAGLSSTLAAARSGKRILLANKESLVMAGHLVMTAARESGAVILPIDSEHNAIYQCLPAVIQMDNRAIHEDCHGIKKLWLTASGGGFLHKSIDQMRQASVQDAVKHPNWSMGQKISIDSATMMNKGLELIEACHLFNLSEDRISIVIHPDSVVHSLVEYVDGSFLAQLSNPDMKTPIAHALAYPNRMNANVKSLDLYDLSALTFIKPDEEKFVSLALARFAAKRGVGACITLNAANEVAVAAFLDEKIRLTDIATIVRQCLEDLTLSSHFDDKFENLDEILNMDDKVRQTAVRYIDKGVTA
ncbi:1-deoxy-D-xylulose-5-phosphate reductoisomerase [Moraxella bovoculi]|uniref:1-deoxy-D-xylulose 5-phosphate reductoisomerase n=1 Tax=Moraxella bovoculi 237 TaxID=743974 RepID=A0A066UNF1_9GAMM|nr:1-deoxy-D-xylulose-5-phosphate reductoisomerase [Moraxella bovoculi]AKG15180.2 1-deoxy-D-xylulose 5-phosphate reductoisomerase [Moraxella bovoculi]KDN25708.1 1-deoxy-D-xylulose 5-phosphate reductoisomerase [Moraxella bovoculi 237]